VCNQSNAYTAMAAKELCSLGFEEERLRRDEVRNLRARPAVFFGFREEEQSSRECERDARSGGAKGCRFRLHGRGAVEEDEEARHKSWSGYENALEPLGQPRKPENKTEPLGF
jgi:hypothetical protein